MNLENAIAVIGIACRFPAADNISDYWKNLEAGKDCISSVDPKKLQLNQINPKLFHTGTFVNRAAKLDSIYEFDADFFDFSPREARFADPQLRLILECAYHAIEDSCYPLNKHEDNVGVFVGIGENSYFHSALLHDDDFINNFSELKKLILNSKDYVATTLSYKLGLQGPSYTINTACSTSLIAIHEACLHLSNYECDYALAGASNIINQNGYFYNEGGITSPDGYCRAFDENANGTVFGSGAGIVVLKRAEEALEDNDCIYAFVLGSAVNNDGNAKIDYTAPSVKGQADVIYNAILKAEVDVENISYIETHGTGTPLGDPIEFEALQKAFGALTTKRQFCALGSVKTNLGHLNASAGIAGFIKTVLSLKNKKIPATLHFNKANAKIDLENSPFYINHQLKEWHSSDAPRIAGVSSFGVGGTNAHMILREGSVHTRNRCSRPSELLLLSAKSSEALEMVSCGLASILESDKQTHLREVSRSLQTGRRFHSHRKFLVCNSKKQAVDLIRNQNNPAVTFKQVSLQQHPPKIVFMFPGQGSQYTNMALGLYQHESGFKDSVDYCLDYLKENCELDIRKNLYPAVKANEKTENELHQTSVAQAAIFVISYSLAKLLLKLHIRPQALIGHGVGEYVAACISGVFSLDDALKLIALRGKVVQSCDTGGMLAVTSTEKNIRPLLKHSYLDVAALNSPNNVVVSGGYSQILELKQKLAREGIESKLLVTSHAFHSSMLDPVIETFQDGFRDIVFHKPEIPFISNLTGSWIDKDEIQTSQYWCRHLRHTVRFSQGIGLLQESEQRVFIEIGPGNMLTNLFYHQSIQANKAQCFQSIPCSNGSEESLAYFQAILGNLWLNNVDIEWRQLHLNNTCHKASLPAYPFQKQTYRVASDLLQEMNPFKPVIGAKPTLEEGDTEDWVVKHDSNRSFGALLHLVDWLESPLSHTQMIKKKLEHTNWLIFSDNSVFSDGLSKLLKGDNSEVCSIALHRGTESGNDLLWMPDREFLEMDSLFNWYVDVCDARCEGIVVYYGSNRDRSALDCCSFLLNLYHALVRVDWAQTPKLWVVTQDCQFMETTFRIPSVNCNQAAMWGFANSIMSESPEFRCTLMDLDQNQSSNEILVYDNIVRMVDDTKIAFRENKRFVQVISPFQDVEGKNHSQTNSTLGKQLFPLDREKCFLVTGAGALSFHVIDWLVEKGACNIVLISRNFPSKKTNDYIEKLSKIKVSFCYEQTDVSDQAAMEAITNRIFLQFSLGGVIHCAGVTDDGILINQSRDRLQSVLRPKVEGSEVLHRLTEHRSLDFFVCFSSTVALLRSQGQSAYAAANSFMDGLVQYRRSKGLPGLTINWGAWAGKGMAQRTLEKYGISNIPEHFIKQSEAVKALDFALEKNLVQLVVTKLDKGSNQDQTESNRRKRLDAEIQNKQVGAKGVGVFQSLLLEAVCTVLGLDAPIQINKNQSFAELGFDSLLLTELKNQIYSKFSLTVPYDVFFEKNTVESLLVYLEDKSREREEANRYVSDKENLKNQNGKQEIFPLSFSQRQMWLLNQHEGETTAYNCPMVFRFKGEVNRDYIVDAFLTVVKRHEILRTVYVTKGDTVHQTVLKEYRGKIDIASIQRSRLSESIDDFTNQLFDLEKGPVIKMKLLSISNDDTVVIINVHHIAFDFLSYNVFIKELAACYQAFVENRPVSCELYYAQFSEYSLWQQNFMQSQAFKKQFDFWVQKLDAIPPVLSLFNDQLTPLKQPYPGNSLRFRLNQQMYEQLNDLCVRSGSTPYMVLFSVFLVLLSKYSNMRDIVVGSPFANRNSERFRGSVGFFANMVVLRQYLDPTLRFLDFLSSVRQTVLEALENQAVPFEYLVEKLNPARNAAYSPLVQIVFAFQNKTADEILFPGIKSVPTHIKSHISKFDLSFELTEQNKNIWGNIIFNTDRFDFKTIQRLSLHYKNLLESILECPEQEIAQLEMLTHRERQLILKKFNETDAELPLKCIHELFEDQVRKSPDSIALIMEDQAMTYGELNHQANKLAGYLSCSNVRSGSLVGISSIRSVETIIGILAILKVGGGYVPINPRYPTKRIESILVHTGITHILVHSNTPDQFQQNLPNYHMININDAIDGDRDKDGECTILQKSTPESIAYVNFTSGSTGEPKGVLIDHRAVCRLVYGMDNIPLSRHTRILQLAPLDFDAATFEIWGALLHGGSLILYPDIVPEPTHFEAYTKNHRSNTAFITSALFNQLVDLNVYCLAEFKYLLVGGESLSPPHIKTCYDHLNEIMLFNGYGPTECCTFSCYYPIPRDVDERCPIPIGYPLGNTSLFILDSFLKPVPVGVKGELYIGGLGLAIGYLNNKEKTDSRFLTLSFPGVSTIRLYKTGDLARWNHDGAVEYLDREDRQLKINGYRVELNEIESVLAGIEFVKKAVVVPHDAGSGLKKLIAYYELTVPNFQQAKTIKKILQDTLPEYMVPSLYVELAVFPLKENGKIDYKALPKPSGSGIAGKEFEAPCSDIETSLVKIWKRILELDQIGVHDSFFDLGGNSLMATRMVARCHEAGLHLSLAKLYQFQSIRQLAKQLENSTGSKTALSPEGGIPLTINRRLVFAKLKDLGYWNHGFLVECDRVNVSLLEKAIEILHCHHDGLRIRFRYEHHTWHQYLAESKQIAPLVTVDLKGIAKDHLTSAIETACSSFQGSLSLTGDLTRFVYFDLGQEKRSRLLLIVHHILADAYSLPIILEDLLSIYNRLENNLEVKLPPKTDSVKQWAECFEAYRVSSELKAELVYWQEIQSRDIPSINSDFESRSFRVNQDLCYFLSHNESRFLNSFSATLELLLIALIKSLKQLSRSDSLWFNFHHFCRDLFEELDLSRTVGWFITPGPLFLDIRGITDPVEQLMTVRSQIQQRPKQGMGYHYLTDHLGSTPENTVDISPPTFSFHYIPRTGAILPESSVFIPAKESSGDPVAVKNNQTLIDSFHLEVMVVEAQFRMRWLYDAQQYKASTIENVARRFLEEMDQQITFWKERNNSKNQEINVFKPLCN